MLDEVFLRRKSLLYVVDFGTVGWRLYGALQRRKHERRVGRHHHANKDAHRRRVGRLPGG